MKQDQMLNKDKYFVISLSKDYQFYVGSFAAIVNLYAEF